MKSEHLPDRCPKHLPRPVRRPPTPRRHGSSAAHRRPAIGIIRTVETWVADGRAQGFSDRSLADRRGNLTRFCWWLTEVEGVAATLEEITGERVRRFLTYCREANPCGRFGSDHPKARVAARPSTVMTYFRDLRTFCVFCQMEGLLDTNPLHNVKAPKVPNDQVQPFTAEQVRALLAATAETPFPERNRAIIMVLVDTGLRVSELCGLQVKDADHVHGEVSVLGKGGKRRTVYLGTSARRALKRYLLRWRPDADPDEPLITSGGGQLSGSGMTRFGILQVIRECGQNAGLQDVRCSPHSLRHTFAVSFLRAGGNLFELQRLMGHSSLTVLRRYVLLADGDLRKAHQAASPADRMQLR